MGPLEASRHSRFLRVVIVQTIKVISSIILIVAATLAIAAGASYWIYMNYDETANEGWSSDLRIYLYHYKHLNEERITLEPDVPSIPGRVPEIGSLLQRDDYEFKQDWFTRKSPSWVAVLERYKGKKNVNYLEVGAYEGMATAWMFENILTDPSSTATVIDIFYEMQQYQDGGGYSEELRNRYLRNVARAGGADRTRTMTEFSQTALRKLPLDHYDIIYIDGSHYAPAVLEDAVLAVRLLKGDGILIFDDYRWHHTAERLKSPRYAIDIFLEMYGEQFEVLHTQGQMILRRIGLDRESVGLGDNQDDQAGAE